jgi:hypothetical protein
MEGNKPDFTLMKKFFKRITYKVYIQICINLLWIFWYLRNFKKIIKISRIFDTWNREIPSFSTKFPYLNSKTFIINYKYWIHWIRRMDSRERQVFNNLNPILLINDEEWLHLDLSTDEIPVVSYSFYFAYYKWLPTVIFKNIEHFQNYLGIPDATNENLLLYIQSNIVSERRSRAEENIRKKQGGQSKLIIDEEGIRLSSEYLKELKRSKKIL